MNTSPRETPKEQKPQSMGNYVIACCNYYSIGVGGQMSKQELDKSKNLKLITPVIYAIIEWTVDTVKLLNNVVVGTGNAMATFTMPALCLVCEKRCDGQFFCSDECYEKHKANTEAAKKNKEALDGFFNNLNI